MSDEPGRLENKNWLIFMAHNGEIVCNDIGKVFRYGEGKRLPSSVNLTIPANGIFALIGRNGAGKTTLTRILSTLLEPTSGKATIDGLDVMADAKKLKKDVGSSWREGQSNG